ncbi:MAG: type II secretion system F family protein [Phycisphaerae bacterium]|nr:type II secretion system F family protein [Phycisphaerae bacterium]
MGRPAQRANVYYKLATLVDAGIPLLRALEMGSEGSGRALRSALQDVRLRVTKGMGLAEAMGCHPTVFADFDRVLIEAAETSGRLDECFKMLADWYQFVARMRGVILSGLTYPLFILHAAALVPGIPGLVLGSLTLWGYVGSVVSTLALFYVPLLGLLAVLSLGRRVGAIRAGLDVLVDWIPVAGKAVRELSISRLCRAFNMLYKAGIPIGQCLAKAPQVAGNTVVARAFRGGARAVAEGREASTGLSRGLPAEYLEIWRVGEESGQLEKSVDKIAEISGDRAERTMGELARWVPRLAYFAIMLIMLRQILRLATQIGGAYQIGEW